MKMKIPFLTEDTRMVLAVMDRLAAGASDHHKLRATYDAVWKQSSWWNRGVLTAYNRYAERVNRKRLRKERAASELEDARVALAKALMGEEGTEEGAVTVPTPVVIYEYVVPPRAPFTGPDGITYFNSADRPRILRMDSRRQVSWKG